jgi:hypothetical protein
MMICVRPVERADIPALAQIEKDVWRRLGTPVLSEEDLTSWLDEESPFFLVAESGGVPCGFYFGRRVRFSIERCGEFFAPSLMTGTGWSRHAHDPRGNSLYGITIASTLHGTGRALYEAVYDLLDVMALSYSIGITRLSGLDAYLTEVESKHGGTLPYGEDEIALWYAHESAERLGMRTWKECAEKPRLEGLPKLERADRVLAFHVRGTTFGLLGTLPGYIVPDPESRGYGAMILSAFPHR